MKGLYNSLNMDGTFTDWALKWDVPPATPMAEMQVTLPGGDGVFSFASYLRELESGTRWLENETEARLGMRTFVSTHQAVHRHAYHHPERTTKSFVLSEAESISRDAKVEWCARQPGAVAVSLQHDGVVIALAEGMDIGAVTTQLERISSEALGYEQPCTSKAFDLPDGADAPPRTDIASLDVWRPPLAWCC